MLDRLTVRSGPSPVVDMQRAVVHLGLGEHDRALDLLERGLEEPTWHMRLLKVEPFHDPIRVFKPRGQWHTFWNAGDTPCEIIEVISPAGFENYFREVAANWGDLEAFAAINDRYELEMDFESVPGLCERFGLTFPEL